MRAGFGCPFSSTGLKSSTPKIVYISRHSEHDLHLKCRTHRIALFMETTGGGGGSFLHSGQSAEIVSLYSEDRVELAAKVLESDHRG